MQKIALATLLMLMIACQPTEPTLTNQSATPYEHPIPFAPEEYVCYQATERIVLDGKLDEGDWQKASWTADFVDIEGDLKPKPKYRTRAKMLWDDQYFYFAAVIEEPHLWATITERDAVMFQNDDFEIFIDPDGDGHRYYEFEMNPNNAIWDLFMLEPYRVDTFPAKYLNDWDIKGIKTGVHLEGTINDPSDEDQYWSVEVAMPWSALKAVAPEMRQPIPGEQWRVNFSRVDWWMDVADGKYQKQTDPNTGQVKKWPEETGCGHLQGEWICTSRRPGGTCNFLTKKWDREKRPLCIIRKRKLNGGYGNCTINSEIISRRMADMQINW